MCKPVLVLYIAWLETDINTWMNIDIKYQISLIRPKLGSILIPIWTSSNFKSQNKLSPPNSKPHLPELKKKVGLFIAHCLLSFAIKIYFLNFVLHQFSPTLISHFHECWYQFMQVISLVSCNVNRTEPGPSN
jgi:hypothetical protein